MNTSVHLCRWYDEDRIPWELRAQAEGTDDINITIKRNGLEICCQDTGGGGNNRHNNGSRTSDTWPSAHVSCVWFQDSVATYTRTTLFWVITQWIATIHYRRFGTTYRPHLQGGCPETSAITTCHHIIAQKSAVLISYFVCYAFLCTLRKLSSLLTY
jgi:hypothetical protein